MDKRLLKLFAAILFGVIPSMASGALTLSLQPVASGTILAGQIDPVNLVLTGTRTSVIASIELRLSALASGASYTSIAPNTDGFAESAALNADLTTTIDGSLKDNLSLSYAAGPGIDGIPVGSDDFVVGTLFVQTPPGVAGNYAVNLAFADLLSATITEVPVQTSGYVVQTVAPEPGLFGLLLIPLICRRRRCRHLREWAN